MFAKYSKFNIWVSQLGEPEGKDRRRWVRVTFQAKLSEVPTEFGVVRIPLEVRIKDGRLFEKIEAMDISREAWVRPTADLLLPLGEYEVTTGVAPGLVHRFRLQEGRTMIKYCEHGGSKATTRENRVVADHTGQISFGEQYVEMQRCCRENFSNVDAENAYSVALYLPEHHPVHFVVAGREQTVSPGEYVVVNPLEAVPFADHQSYWPLHVRRFILEQPFLRRMREAVGLSRQLGKFGFSPEPRALGPGLTRAVAEWDRTWKIHGVGRRERLETVFQWIFLELIHEHPNALKMGGESSIRQTSIRDPRLQEVIGYLKEHFNRPLEMRQVAKSHGVSVRWLNAEFQDRLGVTPFEFLQNLRVNRAMEMLKSRSNKVEAVARAVGYKDVRSFYKVFKTHMQATTRVFRRSS